VPLLRVGAGVALVDIRKFDCGSGHLLDPFGERRNLLTVALVGRCYGQGQQVVEGVDCDMPLRSFAAFGPVVARAAPTFGRGLQRSAVDADHRGLALAPRPLAHDGLPIGH
jgi:hypothetical protein